MKSEQNHISELVGRFETMLKNDTPVFFEEEEFEDIADYYMRAGRFRRALDVAAMARNRHPFSPVFLVIQAQIHIHLNENRVALQLLQEAERIEPFYGDIHMTRGTIYSQMGLSDKAIESFETAGQHDIPMFEVNYYIACELINQSRHTEAAPLLRRAVFERPDFDSALNELSLCYEVLDDREESIQVFQKCVDERPYSPTAWFCLGVSLSRAEKFTEALDAFDYALLVRPDFPPALFNKANALAQLGRHQEAIDTYKAVLDTDEPQANVYLHIGELYEHINQPELALVNYSKAIRLDSALSDAWLGMGIVLDQQNRLSEGIHYIKKALELEPENTMFLHTYGDFQRKLGFYEEAETAYRKVLELEPDDPGIWADYSQVQHEQQDYTGALETLAEGIKYHPDDAELYYRFSACLLANGFRQEAFGNLQRGLELDFSKHDILFDFMPQLRNNPGLIDFIEAHRP
ncbi:MAG: tetratricopeptide repeat protein [Bacteroidia bacterium]|jgi:tetratricopeptide (TPR) repeat protein|nr:tetratricopeptide repeat protein [Bacteroidia bacterium]